MIGNTRSYERERESQSRGGFQGICFAVLDSTKLSNLWRKKCYILSHKTLCYFFSTVQLIETISLLSPLNFTFTFQVKHFTFTFQVKCFTFTFQVKYFTFQVKIAILLFYLLLKSASSMFSTDKLVKYIWEMGPVMAAIC